jgi:hypothetical protein
MKTRITVIVKTEDNAQAIEGISTTEKNTLRRDYVRDVISKALKGYEPEFTKVRLVQEGK